jgi:uncharacterized protein YbjQ (UPF0145 family)
MKVSTSSYIDEDKYEIIEVVHGVSIRSFSFFRQFLGGMRSWFGGKAEEFEEKYLEAWKEAWDEMVEAGKKRGAVAIYGVDVDVSEISMGRSDGMVLIAASGTAVRRKGNRRNNNRKNNQKAGKRKPKKKTSKTKRKKRVVKRR